MLVVRLERDPGNCLDQRAIAARMRNVEIADDGQRETETHAAIWIDSREIAPSLVEDRLRSRQHVLFAAIPCWTQDEWQRVTETARRGGVQLAVVNPDRYLASRQLVRQQIGGPLGTAGLVRIHTWQPADGASECRGLPAAVVRELDVALWLIGETSTVVYAAESKWDETRGQGRSIHVHLGFDEAMALVDCEVSGAVGAAYRSLSVIGSSGAAYVDDQRGAQLLFNGGPPQAVVARESHERHVAAMIQDFADSIAAGRDLTSATLAWNDVFAVADAVLRSIETRQAVKLDRPMAEKGH